MYGIAPMVGTAFGRVSYGTAYAAGFGVEACT